MKFKIFKDGITGDKNTSKGMKSQDYIDYKVGTGFVIGAVADGHSTSYFKYSKEGAEFACKAAINVLEHCITDNKDDINTINKLIKDKEIQREIYYKWIALVKKHYYENNPVVYNVEYRRYGTTLCAVLITKEYTLYLKIGDSSIIKICENKSNNILEDKGKGYIVDSMSDGDAFMKMYTHLESNRDNKNQWLILFTDGFGNSFIYPKDLYNSLSKTIYDYNKNIFSRYRLLKNYKNYLKNLSDNSTKDDVSILFINIS